MENHLNKVFYYSYLIDLYISLYPLQFKIDFISISRFLFPRIILFLPKLNPFTVTKRFPSLSSFIFSIEKSLFSNSLIISSLGTPEILKLILSPTFISLADIRRENIRKKKLKLPLYFFSSF